VYDFGVSFGHISDRVLAAGLLRNRQCRMFSLPPDEKEVGTFP
jgi:hypothetical protein